MFARFLFALIGLCFSVDLLGQTLTISSSASSGSYSISGTNPVTISATGTANIAASVIQGYLNAGTNVVLSAEGTTTGDISIQSSIISTGAGDLILKASRNIQVNASLTLQTNTGDVIFWSDADNNALGAINLYDNTTINTANGLTTSNLSSGGKIILAGGSDDGANDGVAADGIPDGYASTNATSGIWLGTNTGSHTQFYSGGGDVVINGKSTTSSGSTNAVGVYSLGILTINSGNGSIRINGSSATFYGINFTHPSSNITTGTKQLVLISNKATGDAIRINGTSSASYGVVFNYENPKEILATGGGNVFIKGTSVSLHGIFFQNQDVLATAGTITIDGGVLGIRVPAGGVRFGSRTGSAITSSTANVKLIGDVYSFDNLNSGFTTEVKTTGSLTLEPFSGSYTSASLSYPLTNLTVANTISGLTFGKSGSTTALTIASAQTISGPISLFGGNLTLTGALTAANADISLHATGAVTQTAALSANRLNLSGTGTFTLQHASNNIGVIAGGSSSVRLGNVAFRDAVALEIGTVTNTGIFSSGTVLVETEAGNLTLAQSINTTSTSTSAITLNASRALAAGNGSGGNIIVSGSPTLTYGSGGIAKLFSGYAAASTGLTALAGGSANTRAPFDEASTVSPTLSANNTYAIYRVLAGTGNLTIVSSGGDTEGSTWTYSNGTITTLSSPVNVLNTFIQSKLGLEDVTIEANKITFSANIVHNTANNLKLLSKTHIEQTLATTISTQGGDVFLASNVDDATDGETTTNGYIQLRNGITINTNGGDITFGGGNTSGTDYALGSSAEAYTEGIRFDGIIALNSNGGNIILRGKSYARTVQEFYGASGIGFYYFSGATGTINSGIGTITIDGFSQTNTSTYASGFYCMNNLTITSANTTADAINIIGKATGASGEAWGIESESILSVLATGIGGGITLSTSKQLTDNYDAVFRSETNLLAASGPIQLKTGQLSGVTNGYLYLNGNMFLGSKAGSLVTSSSSNINIQADRFHYASLAIPKIATTGQVTIQPNAASFGTDFNTSWMDFNQNNHIMSGLTIGKSGNTANVNHQSSAAITVAGPLNIYAGTLSLSNHLTTTNSGNIAFYSDNAIGGLSAQRNVTAAGLFSYIPQGNSFGAAVTFPITNLNLSSAGLLIGKITNTSSVTLNAATINGPITAYGSAITVSGALSAAGNILLDGDTGNFINLDIKGVVINAAVSTTSASNGNITLLGRGGSGSVGYYGNHGIHVQNVIEAGGTGNIELIGYGGLSSSGNNSGCHGVNIDGSSAWIKTNGGNINVTGFGGGAGTGTYSQGVQVWNNSKVSSGGAGTITMSGTGGVNTAWGMRGLVLQVGSIYSAGGTIQLNGIAGSNGTDNSDGLVIYNATLGSASSGPIIISGSAGVCSVCDAITISAASTIGAAGHTNPITIKGNNFAITETNNIQTTGLVTIEPTGTSFTNTLQFPITNLTVANTITGLTLGKSTNTAGITIGAATSINGPINIYGGALTLSAALSTTNTTSGNLSLNGTTLSGGSLSVANGRTLTFNLSTNTTYAGAITGTGLNVIKDGAGILTLTGSNTPNFATLTISGGTYRLNSNQELTLSGALTNNGTFAMSDGATFKQATTGTSITGTGTYVVEKALTGNSATWNTTTSGRFWYMGVPMNSVARSSFGNYDLNTNRLFSYSENTKQYTNITDNAALLSKGTGYVHRRSTDGTLTFSAAGSSGLCGEDLTLSGLTRTSGASVGFHLISNPYMGYLDWTAITKTNVEPTFYIRSNNANNDISALISYNSSTNNYTNTSSVSITSPEQIRYLAPLQAVWVRVGPNSGTGSLAMTRSMVSHQTGNTGLKTSTIFPTLARVNLVDGARFDQMLVFMNQDMINGVDQYDSEKMFVSGNPQIYTMAAGKKLVMNGLNSNKKKISVPLYLELPSSKVYQLQLADYNLEDGLILLEDKQEGTIQDFTIHDTYAFYANSGVLQNRFVLHFFMPDATITAQGPSNSWVAEEGSYAEGGNILISSDPKGKVQISLDQPETEKVEGRVQATDANGRVVYTGILEGLTTEFQLNVPSGIYYLTVTSGNIIENKKVFIQE